MGSISQTWFWLIHIPFLGWGLLAALVALLWLGWAMFEQAMRNG